MDENDPLNPMRPATRRADTIGIWVGLSVTAFGGLSSLVEGRGVAMSLLIALAILPLAFLTSILLPRHRQITAWLLSFFQAGGQHAASSLAIQRDIATAIQHTGVGLSDVNSRLESLERGVERSNHKTEELYRDGLVLLDATQHVIILDVMRDLLKSSPVLENHSQLPGHDDDWLKDQIDRAETYLKLTKDKLSGTYHWYEFKLALNTAGEQAASALRNTPAGERPQALDPYLLQTHVVAKARCEQGIAYLKRELAEGEARRGSYLSRISVQMRLKQPRQPS